MVVAPSVLATAEPAAFMPIADVLASAAAGGGLRSKRLQKELSKLASDLAAGGETGEIFQAFPGVTASGSIDQIKVAMTPTKAPYAGKAWEVLLTVPSNYPMSPPRLNVVTPIYHYAVSTQGHVCLPILHDRWSPASTLGAVLGDLKDLLFHSEDFDPDCGLSLRSWLSELKRVEPAAYYAAAIAHTEQHGLSGPGGDLSPAAVGKLMGV